MSLHSKSKRHYQIERREEGASLVLVVLALVPILALLAMAVDGFALLTSKLEQHNNAEYAALSALGVAIDQTTNLAVVSKIPAAITRAEVVAGKNHYIGNRSATQVAAQELKQGQAGSVTFGFFRKTDRTFLIGGACATAGRLEANGVQVKLNTQLEPQGRETSRLKAIFSGIFGQKEFDSRSQTIAYWDSDRRLKSFATADTRVSQRHQYDTNGDGFVSPLDVLVIINLTNSLGPGIIPAQGHECFDINEDKIITPDDAQIILNYLNRRNN